MLPRLLEKDSVSCVRLSSRMLSKGWVGGLSGTGSAVGVVVLSGRKIVLNPCPVQLPANTESGPKGDGTATTGGVTDGCRTSWIRKSGGPDSRLSRCCLTAM